jgi:glutathione S-transferase
MAAPYELIYYVGVPGRGEHVRLVLEEAGASYTDTASLAMAECREVVTKTLDCGQGNPPYYAPPLFRHGDLLISQTSNILMYLGSKLGLSGSKENDSWRVNALALTALDGLSNEVHDCHHPIGIELYYEDQREESARRSKEWIKNRLPKHLGYWEKVLNSEESSKGPWLLGEEFTYADLVLFQASTPCFLFDSLLGFIFQVTSYQSNTLVADRPKTWNSAPMVLNLLSPTP